MLRFIMADTADFLEETQQDFFLENDDLDDDFSDLYADPGEVADL